jgi:hypothetical protein
VDSADKALQAAVELGGTVLREPADTPYGRIGSAADPMGARFSVVSRG